MNTPPASPPTASSEWWVFDLSLPGRRDALAKEGFKLHEQGSIMFVAGHPSQPHEFINGVEVEEQWLKNDRWRNSLEALRTELASAVDGEVFLRGARRAVWMANRAQTGMPTLIHGAGLTESLAAWLAGKLLNVPFSACIGAGEDLRWTSKLVNQIKAEARCFVTVTPSPSA